MAGISNGSLHSSLTTDLHNTDRLWEPRQSDVGVQLLFIWHRFVQFSVPIHDPAMVQTIACAAVRLSEIGSLLWAMLNICHQ